MRVILACITLALCLSGTAVLSFAAAPAAAQPTLVLVDPFTSYISGLCREYCTENDIRVVEAVSPYTAGALAAGGKVLPPSLRAPEPGEEAEWAASKELTVPAASDEVEEDGADYSNINANVLVISESDAGVATAERVQSFLKAPGNGVSPQLRDKYVQNERAKASGLEVVEQVLAKTWEEAESFLRRLWGLDEDSADVPAGSSAHHYRCVVKPYRGVASDGVHLCSSLAQARAGFQSLLASPRYGEVNQRQESVLVQEFAEGPEFAVDTVTANGETKVVALWRYTKLPCNGAPFVYQCSELVADPSEPDCQEVMTYAVKLLAAQDLKFGPTHTEIKLTPKGPRLMEINARWHAQHFAPIADECLGYNAVAATMDAFFRPEKFEMLPSVPKPFKGRGLIIHLISKQAGTVKEVFHCDTIRDLRSCVHLSMDHEPGSELKKTVDIRTDCGYVLLVHKDAQVVEADYSYICEDLQWRLFELEAGAKGGEVHDQQEQQEQKPENEQEQAAERPGRRLKGRGRVRRSRVELEQPATDSYAYAESDGAFPSAKQQGDALSSSHDLSSSAALGHKLLRRLRRAAVGSVAAALVGYLVSLAAVMFLPES